MTERKLRANGGAHAGSFPLNPLAASVRAALLPGLVLGFGVGAHAAPTGGIVSSQANGAPAGHATIRQSGPLTTINQTTNNVSIDWQTFNVAKHETVRFNQPSARASALNRIFDQKPSEIFGQIKADGRVVLMNPNGVFFKPGAKVNVGSLIAGAMQIGVDDFMSGSYRLEALKDSAGRVVNEGRLEAAPGGDVTLVGRSVANEGVIVATAGRVNLVAGEQVTVDFEGDGLLRFTVDEAVLENATALDDQVANSGEILADGGDVLITASAVDGVFRNAINNGGAIAAARIDKSGGSVRLVGLGPGASVLNTGQIDASAGTATDAGGTVSIAGANVLNTGTLRADATGGAGGAVLVESADMTVSSGTVSATSAGGDGGTVHLLGQRVGLTGEAVVDVSGGADGGSALVGGDFQGKNADVRNATETYVGHDARIAADAGEHGDGGKVIVWADETTRYFGDISARGGSASGDGGNVEVSGKQNLTFAGFVDASAFNGAMGTLLLDPDDLYIRNTGAGAPGAAPGATEDTTNPFDSATGGGGEFFVEKDNIEAIGAGTSLVFTADGNIIFDIAGNGLTLAQNGGDTVTFTAGNGIQMMGEDVSTAGAAMTMTAGAGGITSLGTIDLGGGTLTLDSGGAATQNAGDAIANNTTLVKQGAGTLTLSEANTYTGTTTVSAGKLEVTNAAGLGTVAGGTTVADGATLEINNVDVGNEALTLNGAGIATAGALQGTGAGAVVDGNVTLATASTIGGTGTLQLNGTITATGVTLIKAGSGTVELTADNAATVTGAISVNAGTLVASDAGALGTAGAATTVQAGATLEINNVNVGGELISLVGGKLAGTGAGARTTGAITLSANSQVGGAGTLRLDGIIGDGGSVFGIEKVDAGTVELDGASTYTGATTVTAGTLQLLSADRIADGSALVVNGGTFDLDNNNETVASLASVGAAGTVDLGNATLTAGDASNTTFSGQITGSGGVTKAGTGRLVLDGTTNDYTGLTTVSAGTLEAAHATALGTAGTGTTVSAGATLDVNNVDIGNEGLTLNGAGVGSAGALVGTGAGAVVDGDVTLNTASTIGGAGTLVLNGMITSTVALTKAGTGTVDLTADNSGTMTTAGSTITINAGTLRASDAGALGDTNAGTTVANGGTLEINNVDIGTEALTLNGNGAGAGGALIGTGAGAVSGGPIGLVTASSIGGTGTLTVNGMITSTEALTKIGAGTLVLTADNSATLTGATSTVSVNGGTLRVSNAGALGDTNAATSVGAAGTLEVNNVDIGSEALTLNGGKLAGTGANAEADGAVTLTADSAVGGGGTLRLNGAIGGAAFGIDKQDAGTVELNGASTYTGTTTVTAGTLQLVAADRIADASALVINGGTFDLNDFNETVASLDDAGGGAGFLDLGTATLTAGDAANTEFAGLITGTGGLTKVGTGTLTISNGANTYSGATMINAGTLAGGATDVVDQTAVTIAGGAFLDLGGFDQQVSGLSGAGSVTNSGAAATLTVDTTAGTTTFNGNIADGAGAVALTKAGANTLGLGGTNTYTGATMIDTGTLRADSGTSVGDASAVTVNGTSTFDVNGQTETIGSLAGVGTSFVTLGAGTLTTGGDGTSTTYAGTISGTGGLTKVGAGVQTLSNGANTYSGATNINAGTLAAGAVDAFDQTAVTIAAGAFLDLGGFAQQVTGLSGAGSVTNNGGAGATLTVDTAGGSTTFNGNIVDGTQTVALTKAGANTLGLGGVNTYTGATTVNAGVLRADSGTSVGDASALTLNGTAVFDVNGQTETVGSLAGAAGTSVTLGAGTLTAGGNGGSTTYDGTITGTGGFTKAGAGTMILTNIGNAWTGATTVTGGILRLGASGVIADGSAVVLTGTGVLDLNDFDETVASIASAAAGTQIDLGTATLTAGGSNANTSFAGTIIGTGGLTKVGTGSLTLANGGNAYTGPTAVNAGTLAGGATDAFDQTAITLAGGTFLDLGGFDQQVSGLSGAGSVTNSGAAATLTVDTTAGTTTFNGNIADGAGAVALTKAGANTLGLGGTNTYTGATMIDTGTLRADSGTSVGDASAVTVNGTSTFDVNGQTETIGSLAGVGTSFVTLGAGTLTTGGDGTSTTYAGTISGTGGLTKVGAGVQTLSNGANTYSGATNINAGTLAAGAVDAFDQTAVTIAAGAFLDLGGFAQQVTGLSGAGSVTNNGGAGATLTVDTAGGSTTFNGNIVDGTQTVALTKAGANTLGLGGVNTYTGATTINTGTLRADSGTSVGDASAVTLNGTSVFDVNGQTETVGSLAGAAGASVTLGAGTLTTGGNGSTSAYAGQISGAGGLTKAGAGTFTLSNAALAYTGATTVNGGTLAAGAANLLDGSSGLSLGVAGTFDLGGFAQLVNGLTGTGIVTNSGGAQTLTVDTSTGTSVFNGNIANGAGAVALTKQGANTLALGGVNTYTGATAVNVGTLRLDSGTAIGNTSAVTLAGTAILDLNGQTETVGSFGGASGTLAMNSGSLIASGAGNIDVTTVTVTHGAGNERLAAGGTLSVASLTKANGNLNLASATTPISITGSVNANGGNLVLENDATLTGGAQVLGASGTVTTDAVTKTTAGNLTLGQLGGAVDADGLVDVQVAGSDLLIPGNITASNNLQAARHVTFQGAGVSTFDGGGAQSVTATTGDITDTAGALLAKAGGADLMLVAGGNIGVGIANALAVSLTGGSGVQASANGGFVFLTSPANLLVNALQTGVGGDTVDIRATGGSSITMVGGYTNVAGDAFTLVAGGDLNFITNPLTVTTLAASFGQDGTGRDFDIDVAVAGTTSFTIAGGAGNDTFDAANLATALDFTTAGLDTGSIGNSLTVNSFMNVENLTSGSGNDTFIGAASYVVDGGDTGTTSALNGRWTNIENLTGRNAANDTFTLSGGTLSGNVDGLTGAGDTLAGISTITVDLANGGTAGTATGITGTWSGIENLTGRAGANDVFTLTTGSVTGLVDGLTGTDRLEGSTSYVVTNLNTGTATNTGGFQNVETLHGTAAGMDSFSFNNTGALDGAIDGLGNTDTLTYAARNGSNVTVNLQTGAATSVTGGFANIENFVGSAAPGNDTFQGRDQMSTWTLDGGTEQVMDAATFTFAGFEILQGGTNVDNFNISASVAFPELRGGAGNDVWLITGTSTVTGSIEGEAGSDQVNFGTPTGAPPGAARSTVTGNVNLGIEGGETDVIDFSGSNLFQTVSATDAGGNEQTGTIIGAGPDGPIPGPQVNMIGGTFSGVENFIGNGQGTLIGPNSDTFWNITGTNTGTFGNSLANIAANGFTNFNIFAGSADDVVIFSAAAGARLTGGNPTAHLLVGFNGGGGTNTLMGSIGADTFDIDPTATFVNYTNPTGVPGGATRLQNITNIDSTAGGGAFVDAGNDTFNFGANTWGGFIHGGGGTDTVNLAQAVTATVTAVTNAGMTSATNSFTGTGGFTGIEILNTGAGTDAITLTAAPTDTTDVNQLNLGAGTDTITSQFATNWLITGNDAGFVRNAGNVAERVAFSGTENLTATQNSVLSMPTTAGTAASVAGTVTAPQVALAQNNNFAGVNGLRINAVNGVTGPAGALLLDADGPGNIAIAGALTANAGLTTTTGAGNTTLTGAVNANGAFNATSNSGNITVNGSVAATNVTLSTAVNGNIAVNGDVNATGALTSTVTAGTARFRNVTSPGNQTYNGATVIGGNLAGADLQFNGQTTISGDVLLTSTTDIFDFNGQVVSDDAAVLSIVPTVSRDLFIDLIDGPGHISANKFGGFNGVLSIGGQFQHAAGNPGLLEGSLLSATADYITVAEALPTSGSVLLVGSTIDFEPTAATTDIRIEAGAEGPGDGQGDIVLFALGDTIQPTNDGLNGGADLGDIEAPENDTITFQGDRVMFAATGEILNSTNMIMRLGGGEVLVAQSDQAQNQQVDFNVQSNARESTTNVTDTQLAASLVALNPTVLNVNSLFQNARVFFPNPAAVLTILQAVSFVDASLFEEDLSLFGVIGDGIAKSLDQCEDAEGCAPSVTEEELAALIESLSQRIERIEQLMAAGEMSAAEGERLLAGYRQELQNFLDFQQELRAYNERQEADEFGDEFGDEFDDVFEAEEVLEPAEEPVADEPAFEEPEAFEEAEETAEEPAFEPLDDVVEEEIPVDEFEDIEEAVETFDEPEAPAEVEEPAAPDADDELQFEEFDDDFEELEEELLNDLMKPNAANQFSSNVRIGADGQVSWTGDIVLPTLHRRF